MNFTEIRELYKNREAYLDQKVTVGGWIRSIRDSKTFGFIVVNDGTFFEPLQVVYHDKMDNFAEVSKLNAGTAVIVTGTLVATPQAKQPFEIQADSEMCIRDRVYADLKVVDGKAVFSLKNISQQPLNISADELTERFIRGDISRSTEGSGLGLSIAKTLTEMQGGKFELYLDGDLFRVTITF